MEPFGRERLSWLMVLVVWFVARFKEGNGFFPWSLCLMRDLVLGYTYFVAVLQYVKVKPISRNMWIPHDAFPIQ
ncbi:uncharacterized protein TRIREDRAFT_105405 [Trichoderma reesei QM6a]|uniref:Predicted protein n=2 Tax=Hypocrea jecorina TaxID=51453 RepID=G0REG8_HYPJQ|nr:uncharacterized protein TRIREDRAFT_105405 [Trichoderma reesei QM6a]EGR50362.1 predicted protein [Trichoderma reesei QM6a]ETS03769.1 hypothetical protein M419DRAFT_75108 [Trichoderma reesei RUT C-30]